MTNEEQIDVKSAGGRLVILVQTTVGEAKLAVAKTAKPPEVIALVFEKLPKLGTDQTGFKLSFDADGGPEELNDNRTLVSYGIKDGDVLFLVPPPGQGV